MAFIKVKKLEKDRLMNARNRERLHIYSLIRTILFLLGMITFTVPQLTFFLFL